MKFKSFAFFLLFVSISFAQTEVKSKFLKLKYKTPPGWTAHEFGDNKSWDGTGNYLCHCAGVLFTKESNIGKMNVLVYPTTVSGLDSSYRDGMADMKFIDVQKRERIKNKYFSFDMKHSYLGEKISGKKKYDAIRYQTKSEKHYYIIYSWRETTEPMNPDTEKALFEMINSIEPY